MIIAGERMYQQLESFELLVHAFESGWN